MLANSSTIEPSTHSLRRRSTRLRQRRTLAFHRRSHANNWPHNTLSQAHFTPILRFVHTISVQFPTPRIIAHFVLVAAKVVARALLQAIAGLENKERMKLRRENMQLSVLNIGGLYKRCKALLGFLIPVNPEVQSHRPESS